VGRKNAKNAGAPTWLIAFRSIRVVGAQALQDASSVEEIMDEGIDSDKASTDFEPKGPLSSSGGQQQR
jgi:hypothetical protein